MSLSKGWLRRFSDKPSFFVDVLYSVHNWFFDVSTSISVFHTALTDEISIITIYCHMTLYIPAQDDD